MIKCIEDMKLNKYNTLDDYANHLDQFEDFKGQGTQVKHDMRLSRAFEKLWDIVGKGRITSGYRTPKFNIYVGGSFNSYHPEGLAGDCEFEFGPWYIESLFLVFRSCGFTNATIYINEAGYFEYCHLDVGKPRVEGGLYRVLPA